MTTAASINQDSEQRIKIYGDVTLRSHAPRVIDCRTCLHAGMSTCNLYAGQCSDGSRHQAAPVLRFWRQS